MSSNWWRRARAHDLEVGYARALSEVEVLHSPVLPSDRRAVLAPSGTVWCGVCDVAWPCATARTAAAALDAGGVR